MRVNICFFLNHYLDWNAIHENDVRFYLNKLVHVCRALYLHDLIDCFNTSCKLEAEMCFKASVGIYQVFLVLHFKRHLRWSLYSHSQVFLMKQVCLLRDWTLIKWCRCLEQGFVECGRLCRDLSSDGFWWGWSVFLHTVQPREELKWSNSAYFIWHFNTAWGKLIFATSLKTLQTG